MKFELLVCFWVSLHDSGKRKLEGARDQVEEQRFGSKEGRRGARRMHESKRRGLWVGRRR